MHANNHYGLAFVADSTGHNKPHKKADLSQHYEDFYDDYLTELSKLKFSTLEEVEEFVTQQVKAFGNKMSNVDSASFSLAQIVADADGNLSLITAQTGDTMIVIKRKDEFIYLNAHEPNSGLGLDLQVLATPLEPGDEILGFSDGIVEFFTRDIFEDIVLDNSDRSTLLKELKDDIEGKNESDDKDLWDVEHRKVKVHNLEKNYDDISLFVLDTARFNNAIQLA